MENSMDIKQTQKQTRTEETHAAAQTATVQAVGVNAAMQQAEQPDAVQEMRQQEITEVLPMRQALPTLPQVLQRVAAPMPEQPVPPGDMTFKQRRKLKKLDKEAKKHSEYADHVSLAITEQLKGVTAERDVETARIAEFQERAANEGRTIDGRVLKAFITGHKTDRQGNPLDEQEEEKKRNDARFLDDYSSGDLQRRLPHLERIKNEMLAVRVSPDMLTEAYMEKHAAELYDLTAKMTYFENVEEDPVNAPYFNNLPEVEKKLLKYRVDDLCGVFSNLWISMLASKGITVMGSRPSYLEEAGFHDGLVTQIPVLKETLRNMLREADRKEDELREETLMQARQQGITSFNAAVQNSMPEPALDKALGTETDYENLKSLFQEKTHEETRNGETTQYKGLIEYSDSEFAKHGESSALQAFQIRESGTEAAQKDKILRGEFFLDIQKDYVQMFRNLEDAGVDFEAMSAKFVKKSCGMGAYVSGGGIEQIHDKMLAHFQKYIEAPQGQEYVRKMISILQNAKVFQGKRELCVNFILQCLLNSYGANFSDVSKDGAYYGEHAEAARTVCKESCRNLLSLPRIIQLPDDEKAKLPPEIMRLSEQYGQMINSFND